MLDRMWKKIKKEKDAWLLVIFLLSVFLIASCSWKSPADQKREKYSTQHIHGPHCDHPHPVVFTRGMI